MKKAYNYFKHADNELVGIIEFDPIITEHFIMFTLLGLEILGRKRDEVRGAFNIYWGLSAIQVGQLVLEAGKLLLG